MNSAASPEGEHLEVPVGEDPSGEPALHGGQVLNPLQPRPDKLRVRAVWHRHIVGGVKHPALHPGMCTSVTRGRVARVREKPTLATAGPTTLASLATIPCMVVPYTGCVTFSVHNSAL